MDLFPELLTNAGPCVLISQSRSATLKQGVAFEIAEACLAHAVGNAVTRAYLRTTVPELRRPVMINWANYICPASNVIQLLA